MTEYSAQEIVAFVQSGEGSHGLYSGSDLAADMSKLHSEIADEMLRLQGAMRDHWEGDAAGQAYAGAAPLILASRVSDDHLQLARGLYAGQGESYDNLKNKVLAVGLPPQPADDWASSTPFSFLTNRANEIRAWDAKAKEIVENYHGYHNDSTDNSARWPNLYGELGLPPGGTDILVQPVKPVPQPGHVGGPGTRQNPGSPATVSSAADSGPLPANETAQVQPAGPADRVEPVAPARSVAPVNSVRPVEPVGPISSGSPVNSASSVQPAASQAPALSPGYATPGTTGGLSETRNPYSETGSGFGTPRDSGGSSRDTRGPAGQAGRPGGEGQGSGRGVSRAVAGQSIASRAGGSGAAGPLGHGRKEEDEEHRSPDYLREHDPDEALIGELPKTPPSVIGLQGWP